MTIHGGHDAARRIAEFEKKGLKERPGESWKVTRHHDEPHTRASCGRSHETSQWALGRVGVGNMGVPDTEEPCSVTPDSENFVDAGAPQRIRRA